MSNALSILRCKCRFVNRTAVTIQLVFMFVNQAAITMYKQNYTILSQLLKNMVYAQLVFHVLYAKFWIFLDADSNISVQRSSINFQHIKDSWILLVENVLMLYLELGNCVGERKEKENENNSLHLLSSLYMVELISSKKSFFLGELIFPQVKMLVPHKVLSRIRVDLTIHVSRSLWN